MAQSVCMLRQSMTQESLTKVVAVSSSPPYPGFLSNHLWKGVAATDSSQYNAGHSYIREIFLRME